MPGDDAAPVVTDQGEAAVAERGGQLDDVLGERVDRVRADADRLLGPAVAALIGRDGPKPGGPERFELVSPRMGAFRKAVQQQDRRPVLRTAGGHMEAKSVRGDRQRIDRWM